MQEAGHSAHTHCMGLDAASTRGSTAFLGNAVQTQNHHPGAEKASEFPSFHTWRVHQATFHEISELQTHRP